MPSSLNKLFRQANLARRSDGDRKKHPKSREGRRSIRVEKLLKKASQSGADLRLPVMGGTKFPTQDSIAPAKQKLRETQNVGNPKPVRPKFKQWISARIP